MKYFTLSEFACKGDADYQYSHCGCGFSLPTHGMHPDLLEILELARAKAGKPIHITSGYRCPVHNANTDGAASNSYHMRGMAADSWCEGYDVYEYKAILRAAMEALGIQGGLQEYPDSGFVHVDCRGYWAEWC